MKIIKITFVITSLIIFYMSLSFYKYYNEPINENNNIQLDWIARNAYIKRMENKHDILAFHKLLNTTIPIEKTYWYILNTAAINNIDPRLTAQKLLFLGRANNFTIEQQLFLKNYVANNKISTFDQIYCTYKESNQNISFLKDLKKIYIMKNPNINPNFDCKKINESRELVGMEIGL